MLASKMLTTSTKLLREPGWQHDVHSRRFCELPCSHKSCASRSRRRRRRGKGLRVAATWGSGVAETWLNVSGQRKATAQCLKPRRSFENYVLLPAPEGNVFFSRRPKEPTTGSREARPTESCRIVASTLFEERASRLPVAGSLGRREIKTSPSGVRSTIDSSALAPTSLVSSTYALVPSLKFHSHISLS